MKARAASEPRRGKPRRKKLRRKKPPTRSAGLGLWSTWGLAFGFWTVVGVLLVVQLRFTGQPFWPTISWQLAAGYTWALLTPVVVGSGRRFPIRQPWWRGVSFHLAFCVTVTLTHLLLLSIVTSALELVVPHDFEEQLWRASTHLDLVVYWAILGTDHAFLYYGRFRERAHRASRLEIELAAARLRALRLRLSPRLLLNTLNTIGALVRDHDSDTAMKILVSLSDFLRSTLRTDDRHEVPLHRELELIERYVTLQQIRLSDRLELRLDIAEETLNALLPSMILQPLVERAIEHGIGTAEWVEISAARSGNDLLISVLDNGSGTGTGFGAQGSGISDTEARLEQIHSGGRRLVLSGGEDGATLVTLRIPWRLETTDVASVVG